MAQPETLSTQQPSLNEQLRQDDGFITAGLLIGLAKLSAVRWAAGSALAISGALGLGVWDNASSRVEADPRIDVSAPPAEYRGSFTYNSPIKCFGGHQSDVAPEAEFSNKINVDFPIIGQRTIDTHVYLGVKEKFEVTNVTCAQETSLVGVWSNDNTEINADLSKVKFISFAFKTDPTKTEIKTTASVPSLPGKFITEAIKALEDAPLVGDTAKSINTGSYDQMYSKLQGYAELAAYDQATTACGKIAMKDVGGPGGAYAKTLEADIARKYNVAADKVHVTLPDPDTFELTNQYDAIYTSLKGSKAFKDGHITVASGGVALKCNADPAKYGAAVELPQGVTQPSIATGAQS